MGALGTMVHMKRQRTLSTLHRSALWDTTVLTHTGGLIGSQ